MHKSRLPLKSKQYAQKFRPEWKKDERFKAWLESIKDDDSMAACKFCHKTFQAKLQSIKKHLSSDAHQQNEKTRGLGAKAARAMEAYLSEGSKKVEEKKSAELQRAAFVAEHASLNSASHLAASISKHSSKILPSLGRTKVSMLLKNVIAPSFKDLILTCQGKPYSLIIDEATDISLSKILDLIIRFVDRDVGKVHDAFYRLIQVSKGDADTIANTIKACMHEDGLDLKWQVGLGVDGASVMVRKNHSVSTILKQSVPHLTACSMYIAFTC